VGFDVVAGYAAGIGGLAMVAVVAFLIQKYDISTDIAVKTMARCLRDRKIERARKFCYAAPGSFFDAIQVAIVAGQTSSSRDRVVLESVVFPAFDTRADELTKLRKARIEVGLIGVLLAAAGLATGAWSGPIPTPLLVIVGLAILVGAWLLFRGPRLRDALARSRAEILPELVAALIDGERPKDPPAKDDGPFRTSAPMPVVVSEPPPPARAKPGTSLRDGECPLCNGTNITRVDVANDSRFHKLVCAACGYTQEFADLAQI
jgi:hypothetical protein